MSQSHTKAAAAVTSTSLLDDAKALAEKITSLVGPAPALTKADVARSAKLRKGGEPIAKAIVSLSDKLGLVVPSHPTATIVEKIDQAESLVALHQEMMTATKHVADAIFQAQSQGWDGATAHYTMLRRLARTDGSVAKPLQPVVQFFAARSASVTEEAKASRGGARKDSAKAKANRAAKRAEEAAILANSEKTASTAGNAPAAGNNGASTSPQATTAPSGGAGH